MGLKNLLKKAGKVAGKAALSQAGLDIGSGGIEMTKEFQGQIAQAVYVGTKKALQEVLQAEQSDDASE